MLKNKILLVEDDGDIILWIEEYLKEFNFTLDAVCTVTDAISYLNQYHYDIVILDLGLPDYSGYDVLNYISKNKPYLPIIVASGNNEQKSKIDAFNLGASDYMVKPIDLAELEARIRVHINKTNIKPNDETSSKTDLFKIESNNIIFKGEIISFTKTEFDILASLIKNKNVTVSRNRLCESLSSVSSHRSLDYHIRNIRKKLGDDSNNPIILTTEYGVGYKLIF